MREIDLGNEGALFVGTDVDTRAHAHLAHKVVVMFETALEIEGGELIAPGVWLVQAARANRIVAPGRVAFVFVDAGLFEPIDPATSRAAMVRVRDALRTAEDSDGRWAAVATFLSSLPRIADRRVARAASHLSEVPNATVPSVAARVNLSGTRLTHLFTERVGMPPRQYRTCGTLRRSLALMMQGASLTRIAHEAGFADSGHLSRVFVQMLGVSPSTLVRTCAIRLRD
jgi:AraC-like DNA-binding protein